jgi:hypothetical protein
LLTENLAERRTIMFSPMLAIRLVSIDCTVSPPSTEAALIASTPSTSRAATAILRAAAWNSSLRATKSVSALTSTTVAVWPAPSSRTATATRPSAATRSDFLAALDRPLVRSQSIEASTLPSFSTSARLQSIMPAPDFSRRSFTSAAVISAIAHSPV